MPINITLPKITAGNPTEQMRQMQSYIYQLAEQLNWALSTIESSSSGNVSPDIKFDKSGGEEISQEEAESTFNSIKALIIKSADIVKAYEETIFKDFNGKYFADSDFGTYIEDTNTTIEENSKYAKYAYTNVQTITREDGEGRLDKVEKDTQITNAYIKRGFLYNEKESGKAVYGVEVGEEDEKGVFKQYARFLSDRLSFFDENGSEVAYISQYKLYIRDAAFTGTVQFGGYKMDTTDGLAFTWIG